MGRVEGKVALVTGGARGQGRAHALRLAEEGADILILDICSAVPGAKYEAATEADLAETVESVKERGRRVIAHRGDVRRQGDVDAIIEAGIEQFGHIDVVVSNAGVGMQALAWEITDEDWYTQIETHLTGSWRVAKSAIPHMIEAGNGGSIILTTSGVVARGMGNLAHYSASKSGLDGLCRELAVDLGPYGIRVNTLQPTSVNTVMMDNRRLWEVFTPGQDEVPLEERRQAMLDIMTQFNILPVPWVEPEDMANGVLFLASDESRMVTGTRFVVDAGYSVH